ncbi:gamma-glutamylcyclotransferase family protein [Paenibacillus lupini]|uniref:gamma-glutamylcyclotransferase family protein n=1 Tax=Paenibacillus lupini TaxID=1450204 RepID=UPI00313327E4|nr:gamma-glutamylcyclotransferase (GGCT)/AIG2-like uncharacterized protein YtfP [Paenibacillus lupini]
MNKRQLGVRVFVYGSLLPGLSNHQVVLPYIRETASGTIPGRLVDVGEYPAAVRDQASRNSASVIQGLWLTIDPSGLVLLDELEDFYGIEELNDYERIWVRDIHHRNLEGWVYIWPADRGCPAVSEVFWPDYLKKLTGK